MIATLTGLANDKISGACDHVPVVLLCCAPNPVEIKMLDPTSNPSETCMETPPEWIAAGYYAFEVIQ